jgi:hypothetical protein
VRAAPRRAGRAALRPPAWTLIAALLTGCATAAGPTLGDVAGEWRGRWLGPSGHASAALAIRPDGAYRLAMFLDGGDRVEAGVLTPLASGRLRYQGGSGNGEIRLESAGGAPALRFLPDGGGGGGAFRRAP